MNIFKKSAISLGEILVLVGLTYHFVGIFFAQNQIQLAIGFFVLIFITLPTIFIFFFKKNFLEKHSKFTILWKIILVIYIISILLFAFVSIVGKYRSYEQDKTNKTIEFINSKKITLDDVMGKNLPPKPNQELNDSTIAGIDANNNYIRDDVELAIFEKYPNSAKIRAAELQYAQALQLELTQVYNSETYIKVLQKEDSAFFCLGFSDQDKSLSIVTKKEDELINIIINTDLRLRKQSDNFKNYMTEYASSDGNDCDIEI